MKIVVLIAASIISFGLACKDAVQTNTPVNQVNTTVSELEMPVAHVVLDTVEISVVAPKAVAGNFR